MEKILIISNDTAYTYDLRKEIIVELQKKFEVHIILPHGNKETMLLQMGCVLHFLELDRRGKNIIKDINLLYQYDRLVSMIDPKVVLTFTIKPNIYGGIVARKYGIPYVANITGLGTAVENKGIMQAFSIILYKFAFKKINYVFFQNEENMIFFQKKRICKGKYVLLPGSGVNTEEYKYLSYPESEKINFLYISRIMKEKGIDEYIELAKFYKNKGTKCAFHILGKCDKDYETIIESLQQKEIVEYHGVVDDVIPFIKEAHCLIHPSFYPEGMSNVCLEAAASGRPVITTNRSGCRETVDDGISGYICEIRNVKSIIRNVSKFLELTQLEKEEMGKNGRIKMKREFERTSIVKQYSTVVSELV